MSRTSTSVPCSRRASATRRPERRDTSRSWDRPPASTTTRDTPDPPPVGLVVTCVSSSSGQVGVRRFVPATTLVRAAGGQSGAERVAQLQLLLDHADQAAYPLADPFGRGIAVRQPHALRTEAVGEERGAGD